MIFHLSAGGYPSTWTITAVYKDSLGLAIAAADVWYDRTYEGQGHSGRPTDCPQCIVEIDDRKGKPVPGRTHLRMGKHHLLSQMHDAGTYLVQMGTAPFEIPEEMQQVLTTVLKDALTAFGFIVPRDEWERRYPSKTLTSKRFAEFNEAYRLQGNDLAYEPKWAMFMEPPSDVECAHDVKDDGSDVWSVTRDGEPAPDLTRFTGSKDDATNAMRMLNSGWSIGETAIHMTPEPRD